MRFRLIVVVLLSFMLATSALAMDRWAALSMLETGDNDDAVGPGGEVSRFQIQPSLWPGGDSHDPKIALVAAQDIMRPRLEKFLQSHKRPATDFEFYVLWNAPAKLNLPPAAVVERARRFANLVQRNPQLQTTNSNHQAGHAP
jgi:hypothetical protein